MRNVAMMAILLLISNAHAAVSFSADTYGKGIMEFETDTGEDASLINGNGETSMGLSMMLSGSNQEHFRGLSTEIGRFKIRTPEYKFDMKGLNLEAAATTKRTSEVIDTESLEAKLIGNDTYQEYLDTYKRTAEIELSATGNGTVEESLVISTERRRDKTIFSSNMNGTMLDVKRKLSMTGLDLKLRLKKLEQREVLIHEN